VKSPAVFNSLTQRFECPACGVAEAPPRMPCDVRIFTRACGKFAKAHRYCVAPGELPTVALSLRQPWAWLMIRPDLTDSLDRLEAAMAGKIKDVENRPLRWKFRGRVLVHASATMTRADYEAADIIAASCDVDLPPFNSPALQRGGIIGEFTITDCVTEHSSPWFFGPYGYPVRDAKPLPFQLCKGMLGIFTTNLSAA
jgi:hypothetical protein